MFGWTLVRQEELDTLRERCKKQQDTIANADSLPQTALQTLRGRHDGDDRVEKAIKKMNKELGDELRAQKQKVVNADDLLRMALRVQDSQGYISRTKRIINRELGRIGG
jgi:hypothetical protein